jgi:hypothetical protein
VNPATTELESANSGAIPGGFTERKPKRNKCVKGLPEGVVSAERVEELVCLGRDR